MLGLSVRVMPLLSREVQMSDITVNGLNLTLSRDEQGRGNWEGVGQPARQAEQPAPAAEASEPPAEPDSAPAPRSQPLTLAMASPTVSHASVTYSDAKTGHQYIAASNAPTGTAACRERGGEQG